jgi:hypothetical protein
VREPEKRVPSLILIPESDDPAERARIPQWLNSQTKELRRLFAWIAIFIPLFFVVGPLIVMRGVLYDADGCSQLVGNTVPWICANTLGRGLAALPGLGLVMWTFTRWMIFVMRIYRYRGNLDFTDPEHRDKIDPYDPETW